MQMNRDKIKVPRLGIDIGRVIMAPIEGGKADTTFLSGSISDAMQTPPTSGALAAIKTLVDMFKGNVWLISKAGKNTEKKTRLWLHHWNFYNSTNVAEDNLRFCLKRSEKAIHSDELKINFFIDDRLDVLSHLQGIVPNLYLFGEQPLEQNAQADILEARITTVINWSETTKTIIKDLSDFKKKTGS